MNFTSFRTVFFRGHHLLSAWWRFSNQWHESHTLALPALFMRLACPHVWKIQRSYCSIIIETHKFRFRSNQIPSVPCERLQPWVSCLTVNQISSQSEFQSKKSGRQLLPRNWLLTPENPEARFPADSLRNSTVKSCIISILSMTAKDVGITRTHYLNCIEPPDL